MRAGFFLIVALVASACWFVDPQQTAAQPADDTSTNNPRLEQLTYDGALKRDPVFAPGGEELVYGVDAKDDLIRLLRLNLKTKQTRPEHAGAATSELELAFARGSGSYAYCQNIGNLSVKLVIRDVVANRTVEIKPRGRGGMRSPVFSPDGQRVVYCYAETGPQQIYSVNLRAEDKRTLTKSQGIDNWPSFTPDGQTIVFASSRSGNFEIHAMKADGKQPRQLTDSPRQDIRPEVSPDGNQIVFVSSRDGNREIYRMRLDGSRVQRLTHSSERDDYPTWSPDGKSIVFVSERRGKSDIYRLPLPR